MSEKLKQRRINKKSPVRFSWNFPNFPKFLENPTKNSSESVRTKNHTAEDKGFYFLDFVQIHPHSSDFGKIEKIIFLNSLFFLHFSEIHFLGFLQSWRVLLCIGGPQAMAQALPFLVLRLLLGGSPLHNTNCCASKLQHQGTARPEKRRTGWFPTAADLVIHQSSTNEVLAHQNRTIAIASDFRVDEAKSPEILQKEGVLGPEIAARNRESLATFHRQCSIAFSEFLLSRKSLRFLGSAMGIAIGNRKNRCDFGVLKRGQSKIYSKICEASSPLTGLGGPFSGVWKKDVWEFQAKSVSSGSWRLFLHILEKFIRKIP